PLLAPTLVAVQAAEVDQVVHGLREKSFRRRNLVLADIARDAVQYDCGVDSYSLQIYALVHSGHSVRRSVSKMADLRCLALLPHLTEPLLETGRRNARVVARNEGSIVQLRAEITCLGIRNYLARVVLGVQKSLDKLGK